MKKDILLVLKVHYRNYFEGIKIRLRNLLDIEIEDEVLTYVLFKLERESNLTKLQFGAKKVDDVYDLVTQNLHLIEECRKNIEY